MGLLLALALTTSLFAEDWPEWRGLGRLGEIKESGLLESFPEKGLTVKWRTPIRSGYTGPAVSKGRVFVTDFARVSASTGPALTAGYNGRRASGLEGKERAMALDEKTGKVLWTREWDSDYTGIMESYAIGPRATPTVDGDRVYVQGTMGQLICLSASTGEILWQKNYIKEFGLKVPVWGMTASPLVDGPRVVVIAGGAGESLVMAFDKLTGKLVWKAIEVKQGGPGYAPPTIINASGVRQLIIWHPEGVTSLNPVNGEQHWDLPWNNRSSGMIVATPIQQGNRLFFSSFYHGPFMVELDPGAPKAKLAWKGSSESEINTDGLHSSFSTPVMDGDYIYGVCSYGQFRCLDARTGKRVWETQQVTVEKARWASAFLVRYKDRYFINNDRGELIIAKLSPEGYQEISRTELIKPTFTLGIGRRERKAVHWSHPAYANRTLYTRNDEEIIAVSLAR